MIPSHPFTQSWPTGIFVEQIICTKVCSNRFKYVQIVLENRKFWPQCNFYASAALCCTEGIMFLPCLSRSSVPCRIWLFRFARILNGFRWNSRKIITTVNRLNDYILDEIEIGKEQDTTKKFESTSIGFAAMSNRCWGLANAFTNSLHRLRQIQSRTQCHVHLQISYKYIKNFTAFFSFIRLLYNIFQQPT